MFADTRVGAIGLSLTTTGGYRSTRESIIASDSESAVRLLTSVSSPILPTRFASLLAMLDRCVCCDRPADRNKASSSRERVPAPTGRGSFPPLGGSDGGWRGFLGDDKGWFLASSSRMCCRAYEYSRSISIRIWWTSNIGVTPSAGDKLLLHNHPQTRENHEHKATSAHSDQMR